MKLKVDTVGKKEMGVGKDYVSFNTNTDVINMGQFFKEDNELEMY